MIATESRPILTTGANGYDQVDWANFHDIGFKWLQHYVGSETTFKINGPQSPLFVNYNAMQLDSSVNIFGKGTIRTKNLEGDGSDAKIEVASGETVAGKPVGLFNQSLKLQF